MYSKVIIALVGLFVVKSTSFTINAYENDDNYELNALSDEVDPSGSFRSCINYKCDALCRRKGYAHGICTSPGVCKCYRRSTLGATTYDSEADSFDDVTPVLYFKDNEEAAENSPLRSCNLRWCEQTCRRIGYRGGACVNGRCKCDLLYSEHTSPALSESNSENNADVDTSIPESCNLRWCEQTCRRMGYPDGVCVNGRCKCDLLFSGNPSSALFESNSEKCLNVDISTPKSCNLRWCEQTCRRMGYRGGACVNGRCKCGLLYSKNLSPPLSEPNSENNADADTSIPESCNLRWCEQTCRRMGYPDGVCVNGRCKCDLLLSDNSVSALFASNSGNKDEKDVNFDSEPTAEIESNDIPQNN